MRLFRLGPQHHVLFFMMHHAVFDGWSFDLFYEEMAAAQAPPHIGVIGLGMAGPTIIAHGTDELKAAYLPKMISGEWTGTMNLTEPHAGSDVGALRSRAVRSGPGGVWHLIQPGEYQ